MDNRYIFRKTVNFNQIMKMLYNNSFQVKRNSEHVNIRVNICVLFYTPKNSGKCNVVYYTYQVFAEMKCVFINGSRKCYQ